MRLLQLLLLQHFEGLLFDGILSWTRPHFGHLVLVFEKLCVELLDFDFDGIDAGVGLSPGMSYFPNIPSTYLATVFTFEIASVIVAFGALGFVEPKSRFISKSSAPCSNFHGKQRLY